MVQVSGPDGPINSERFLAYVEQFLVPTFRRGRTGARRIKVQSRIHIKVSYLNLLNFDEMT